MRVSVLPELNAAMVFWPMMPSTVKPGRGLEGLERRHRLRVIVFALAQAGRLRRPRLRRLRLRQLRFREPGLGVLGLEALGLEGLQSLGLRDPAARRRPA
jgi:hypothetical protein